MTRTIIERISAGERDGAIVEDWLVRVGRRWEILRGETGIVERHATEESARRSFARRVRTTGRRRGPVPREPEAGPTSPFALRLTVERRARWQAAAQAAGLPLQDWVRSICDAEANKT